MKRMLVFLCLFLFFVSMALGESEAPTEAVTNHTSVNVRTEASQSSKRVTQLKKNVHVTILSTETDEDGTVWYLVVCGKNQQGYIRGDLLTLMDTAEEIQDTADPILETPSGAYSLQEGVSTTPFTGVAWGDSLAAVTAIAGSGEIAEGEDRSVLLYSDLSYFSIPCTMVLYFAQDQLFMCETYMNVVPEIYYGVVCDMTMNLYGTPNYTLSTGTSDEKTVWTMADGTILTVYGDLEKATVNMTSMNTQYLQDASSAQ